METLAAFLAAQPLLALFLVIRLGYALGEVSLGSLALGVEAVLFVGLAVGVLVPGADRRRSWAFWALSCSSTASASSMAASSWPALLEPPGVAPIFWCCWGSRRGRHGRGEHRSRTADHLSSRAYLPEL